MITHDCRANDVAERIVREKVAPMCAAGFATRKKGICVGGSADTFFDLASLTKSMTAVSIARSSLDRRARLDSILPELADTASASAPIELLLAHRAGLEAHVQLWLRENMQPAQMLREAANSRRSDAAGSIPIEGFPPVYSDLGYMLAGAALARHEKTIDAGAAIERLVVAPLKLEKKLGTARSLENNSVDLIANAAPTEDAPWRGARLVGNHEARAPEGRTVVRGLVHDENAWALTGKGGSGHAGMFGTIDAVLKFGLAILVDLDRTEPVPPDENLDWLVRERPGGTLRAGFDGKSKSGSSAGNVAGPRTFGHLGFTGTSLWIDPDAGAVVALLTNRVHPTRENTAIRDARPIAHDALFSAASA
jgi:CubicO group peptidase (beta-lactamase class C family)